MDVDDSGKIDMCEFINSMAKSKREEEAEDDIRQAFQVQLRQPSIHYKTYYSLQL